jgi:hypothetical protein
MGKPTDVADDAFVCHGQQAGNQGLEVVFIIWTDDAKSVEGLQTSKQGNHESLDGISDNIGSSEP